MPIALGGVLRTSFVGPVTLGAPPLNLQGVTRQAFVGGVRFPAVVTPLSDITADLMDPTAPATVLAPLPLTRDRAWLEQLSDAGNGSIVFQNDDPDLASISEDSLIRFSLKGVPAVVMVCETTDAVLLDEGEEAAEATSWSGRLHVTLTERAAIYPSRGVGQLPIQENRVFDYTAPEYDDSGWPLAQFIGSVETGRFFAWYISGFLQFFNPTPDDIAKDYPDPFAALLWAPGGSLLHGRPLPLDAGGDVYFRQQVNVPDTGSYVVYIICDDTMELSVDGVNVASVTAGNFMSTSQGTVDLTAGIHTFAWHVNNRKDSEVAWAFNPGGHFNPGFGGWSMFRADNPTTTQGFVAHSDTTAKTSGYALQIPGMTPGRAYRLVNDEAAARGVLVPALGCTDLVDSAGNPWNTYAISTRVGNDNFSFLREMSATYIDFAMRVGSFTLDLWQLGGRGTPRSVPLRPPTDPTDPDTGTLHRLERKGESQ